MVPPATFTRGVGPRSGRELVPRTYFLLRLAFFESQRRSHILKNVGLARIHVFRRRLPFMHRLGWQGPKNSNSGMAFGWFCWDRAHTGPTTIHRIDWTGNRGDAA